MRVPGGGASCLRVGRPGSGALPPPTTRPFGRAAGAHCPLAVGAGGAGVGTCPQLHSAHSCELASRAVGAACGCPGGAALAWVWGVRGRALSTLDLLSVRACGRGPLPTRCWCGGCWRGDPSTTPQRVLLRAGFARYGGGMWVPRGGASCLGAGRPGTGALYPRPLVRSGVWPGPTTHSLLVRGSLAWGPVNNPTARAFASWLCALWGRHVGARGGRLLPGCGAYGVGRSPTPDHPSFRACGRGPLPTGCGCGRCGRGDLSPTPQRALLRPGFARCGGGTRAPRGGASRLGVGRPGTGALPTPTTRPFGRAAGARVPLAVGAVCRRRGPAVLGTLSRAAVRRVLCALPGFAAPGGRCGLAPVLLPWLWLAACLSGVPRGPALVRRSSSGPVALGALVGFPVAVVLSPTPGAVAPGFTRLLRGARGGWPRTEPFCLPLAPAEARALGALRVIPARRPAMGLSLAGISGFGLWLRALRWFGVCGPGH